ncbi:DUF2304 domain-containing protein [Arsenicicoccus dermatophilus]|uniref:DUF2304 domain-containing protein n=1 Tax=Arsenicicoccus dermatophilus TaxID=1076331 RepID=UPI001F4CBF08|nr:DUF2304 domain-containing protein [Arsenicicoccus dermatophilus]
MRSLIQLALIAAVVAVVFRLTTARGARTQAIRRLGMMAFGAFAVWSILVPGVWTRVARFVGVGRGTDLLLYSLVVAFLAYVVSTQLRFREFDVRFTRLARRVALDEATRRHPEVAGGGRAVAEDRHGAIPSSTPAATAATVMRPQDDNDPDHEAPTAHDAR